jgi:hypothetical protein
MKRSSRGWFVKAKINRGISIGLACLLAILAATFTFAARQEKPAAQTPAVKPGAAEMQRLNFYLGEWDYTETYPKSATDLTGPANTGLYTSKLGPGGNSLINTWHSQGPVGDSEGLLILTWDPGDKAYKGYVFGNEASGAFVESGGFEGDALVLRSELKIGAQTLKSRNVTRMVAAGTLESDEFVAKNDGPEKLLVHVVAKKKP